MSTKQKYLCSSLKQTKKLASQLAGAVLEKGPQSRAVVLALKGELGAGKTMFLQGFCRGLGIKEKILSPTFVLMKRFELNKNGFKNFYHLDCYRINNYKEMFGLGFKDILADKHNVIAIEWAERIKQALPRQNIVLNFSVVAENKREITVENFNSFC